jgi:hemolysin D
MTSLFLDPPVVTEESLTTKIRLLLVDDQPTVLKILTSYLTPISEFEIVGKARSGIEAIALAATLEVDVILVDIEMPGMDGLETTQALLEASPNSRVLILSSYDQESYIRKALQSGAKGYLLKTTPTEELVHAIQYVHRGYLQFGPGLFEKISSSAQLVIQNHAGAESSAAIALANPNAKLAPTTSGSLALENSPLGESHATQEIIEALPQVWSRALLYLLVTFLGVVIPWAMLFKVDMTTQVQGKLEAIEVSERIDSNAAGTVERVLAKEGDRVKKGQPLLELDAAQVRSELDQLRVGLTGQQNRLVGLTQLQEQTLQAIEVQKQQNQARSQEKQTQVDQAEQTLAAQKRTSPLQVEEKLAQVQQAEKALLAAENSYALAVERWQEESERQERYQSAYDQGAISLEQLKEVQRTVAESRRAKEEANAAIQQATEALNEQNSSASRLQEQLQGEIEQSTIRVTEQEKNQQNLLHTGELEIIQSQERLKDLKSQMATLEAEIAQSQSRLQQLTQDLAKRTIRAKEEGTIVEMPVKAVNAYLQPGQLVARVSPHNSDLILKAYLPNTSNGFITEGLPVKIKISAYDFQDYGVISGKISKVPTDTKPLQTPQGNVEVYELEISLERNCIQTEKQCTPLSPGQEAQADVVIRQRRIIEFFLDPFKKLQQGEFKL